MPATAFSLIRASILATVSEAEALGLKEQSTPEGAQAQGALASFANLPRRAGVSLEVWLQAVQSCSSYHGIQPRAV